MKTPLRPKINAANPDLRQLTSDTWDAIQKINTPPQVFLREKSIVHVTIDHNGETICEDLTIDRLRWILTSEIDFFKKQVHGSSAVVPKAQLFQNLLATPNPPLPHLRGIVGIPMFTSDGTLQVEPGYSACTGYIFAPPACFRVPEVPLTPTMDDLEAAKNLIVRELLGDFPFENASAVAHAVGALILPFVRPLINGPTPLHLISKPKAGTGATLLAEVICLVAAVEPTVMPFPESEEERRRTIFTVLRNNPTALILDNVNKLDGSALASCLTQMTFEDRVVGSSRSQRVPNLCLWVATGNNPELSDEIARRTVPILLNAKVEIPDQRTDFLHPNLLKWAQEHRETLMGAVLTLVGWWFSSGKPRGSKPFGKFEDWAEVIGGILEVSGFTFLEGTREFREKVDINSTAVNGFLESWAEGFGDRDVSASELLPLTDCVLDLGNGNDRSRAIRLGQLLAVRANQRFGNYAIEKRRFKHGTQQWRLQEFRP